MPNEYKDIKGYENLYRVNKQGDVYSLISNKVLKTFYRGSRPDNKYKVVDLHKNGKRKTISVHRMVAEAFIPNPDNLPCVNHKDGNKDNNCVENLEWCTYSENNQHALVTGLKVFESGSKNKNSKLTYDEVVEIKKSLILGDKEYGTRPLGKKYNVDHKVIMDINHDIKYRDVKIPYTFFVCSDIHSGYDAWIKSLKEAGFNQNKYSHKIIVCGDLFDRLSQSRETYNFAKEMIDKGKLIYIKGNHEWLLKQAVNQILKGEIPDYHHFSNGTVSTIAQLCYMSEFDFKMYLSTDTIEHVKETMMPILKWIDKVSVNYVELKNHIFVHSWIPLTIEDDYPKYYTRDKEYHFNSDWRNASQDEWNDAMWGNPFDLARKGFLPDKTIVFGHWHCSTGWAKAEGRSEFGEDAKFEPYYGDGFIAIDACTAHSGKCNVIVLEDEFLEG